MHILCQGGVCRKIRTKTVRGMMSWAHGKFRETLKSMCDKKGKVMINPSESYTSKTCSSCGWIDEKLGEKTFRCRKEGKIVDRDVNGARGIFLRALLGGALQLT